jgi:phosphoglycolate phosphatase
MYLLFDFDGTLVDSFDCVMEKAILLADELNFRKISEEEIEVLRGLSSKELIKLLNIPLYKLPKLVHHMRKHLRKEMHGLAPIAHIRPVIEKLYNADFSLGILTSNSVENVSIWLKSHDMHQFFDFIHNESTYLSKKYLLKRTLKAYKIDTSRTFYICDETRDIDAATKNKMKSIAVTWGYNSEVALLKYDPAFIARHPDDILKICGLLD